jgi:hypothetical protein
MATIHVNRAGTSLGTFSEDEIREGLRSGRFAATDLAWREGMGSWQPLSAFAEFATETPTAPPTPPLGTHTTPPPAVGSTSTLPTEARTGLPWEHRESRGFVNAFIETLVMVLTKPSQAFTIMRTQGGLSGPLLFAAIGGGIGVIIWFIFALSLTSVGVFAHREDAFGSMLGMSANIFMFFCRLLGIVVAPFVFAGLVHLSLMLIGGAKQTFEATFRVIAFTQGATAPLQVMPCCGGLIAAVWCIVANCIGIARAHDIDTPKATLAVFLPLIVCCGGGFLILAMFGGLAALSSHDWSH